MLYPYPAPITEKDFSTILSSIAENFRNSVHSGDLNEKGKDPVSLVDQDYTIREIHGADATGKYVATDLATGQIRLVQAMFFLDVHSWVWSGQFTGTPENLTNALNVLQSVSPIFSTQR